jgi:nicotinamide riboside transporter PnuC
MFVFMLWRIFSWLPWDRQTTELKNGRVVVTRFKTLFGKEFFEEISI